MSNYKTTRAHVKVFYINLIIFINYDCDIDKGPQNAVSVCKISRHTTEESLNEINGLMLIIQLIHDWLMKGDIIRKVFVDFSEVFSFLFCLNLSENFK